MLTRNFTILCVKIEVFVGGAWLHSLSIYILIFHIIDPLIQLHNRAHSDLGLLRTDRVSEEIINKLYMLYVY